MPRPLNREIRRTSESTTPSIKVMAAKIHSSPSPAKNTGAPRTHNSPSGALAVAIAGKQANMIVMGRVLHGHVTND